MRNKHKQRGLTLIELIIATTILLILTGMAVPMARVTIKRQKEKELRAALWQLRDGIDRYKDAADRGAFQIKVGSEGYPPDLDTLVKGVDVGGKKLKFLRRIPTDPMTGDTDWDFALCRTIPTPIPGTATTSLTCIPNRPARRSMAQNTRIGNETEPSPLSSPVHKVPRQPRLHPDRVDDRSQHLADPDLDRDTTVHQFRKACARIGSAPGP